MAFATANVNVASLANGVKFYVGDWSGAVGDAPGTITLAGGRVYNAMFRSEDTAGPQEEPDSSATVTAGIITLTVYNHQTVTNGRFCIIFA